MTTLLIAVQDWRVLQRRHTFSLLISLHQSTHDVVAQRSIVEALANMSRNPTACVALVRREGLLSWLAIQLGGTHDTVEGATETDAQAALAEETSSKKVDAEVVWLRLAENAVVHAGQEDVAKAAKRSDSLFKAAWRGEVLGLLLRAVQSSCELSLTLSILFCRRTLIFVCSTR